MKSMIKKEKGHNVLLEISTQCCAYVVALLLHIWDQA